MIFPWTSRDALEKRRDSLEEEMDDLREQISKKKKKIRRLEKDLYWGRISLSEMKAERKVFVGMQSRIRKVKKNLAAIERRLEGDNTTTTSDANGSDTETRDEKQGE